MQARKKEALVKELYEKYPYPQRHDTTKKGVIYFANWVAEIIGENTSFWKGKKVLELGCGTGELANGLALCWANVTGIDFSKTSIRLAEQLSNKLGIGGEVKNKTKSRKKLRMK